jgi:hypothetical protein
MFWTYQVPNLKSDNSFVKTLVNGFQLGSVFLAQSGQPVTLQSGVDSNGNGDTAGDRVVFNPQGVGRTGSDAFAVCELPGGTTGLSNGGPGSFNVPTGVANGGACFNPAFDPNNPASVQFFPAIGYTPVDPKAKYVVAGPGALTTVGRNSYRSPGFSTLNFNVTKNFHVSESKYFQFKADFFNILNHPSYALSNGNVFNSAGITTATTTQGYVLPTDPNFLQPSSFFSGGIRSITFALKFIF